MLLLFFSFSAFPKVDPNLETQTKFFSLPAGFKADQIFASNLNWKAEGEGSVNSGKNIERDKKVL